ncbi:MAG: phosphate ABC transporter permease PstA [Parolsenella sp.]|uniref:phosphate ABC transporter permease PstA n=1 Tax=Parolsenella sp. TaxID=2083006 RepID=UPI002E791035|nr:phosphate ABC transporter permease PstA [Parolsenella sp.]MEE1372326.1 phosphate ABC transporter permease PstA [Parolsenella sp.]
MVNANSACAAGTMPSGASMPAGDARAAVASRAAAVTRAASGAPSGPDVMSGVDLDAHAAKIGRQDKIATGVLTAIVGLVLALLAAIVIYILARGLWKVVQPGFLTNPSSDKELPGIAFQLFDSFYMLVITLLISVPISLGAAIFLVEYAPDNWITSAASTAIETLSSLPSIVVGMFGSLFFVVVLHWGISIIAGALALTMFNIPILVRVIQQALSDVPRSQRDAALAMGLTRWETTLNVLLPVAMPAIVTGIVISAGRVFGEAAALIFTSGSAAARINFGAAITSPRSPWNIFRPAETLAVHIWKLKMEPTPGNDEIVWGTAAVLIICVLLFNVLARFAGKALARRLTSE